MAGFINDVTVVSCVGETPSHSAGSNTNIPTIMAVYVKYATKIVILQIIGKLTPGERSIRKD